MTISAELRAQVRQRADFACEYCGVTEADVAGPLTIDHYCPQAKGGDDAPGNLVYCCHNCNSYKLDYWPQTPDDPFLWCPRAEPAATHFIELDDGTLDALTDVGAFTLARLRLNRSQLVRYRQQRRQRQNEQQQLARYHSMANLQQQIHERDLETIEEQRASLAELRLLIILLLKR